jgi:hypothetical protein
MHSAIAKPATPSFVASRSESEIADVVDPVILLYFKAINTESFVGASHLFSVDGVLQPPFEEAVIGREAIATYLEKEAKGFILQPERGSAQRLENGNTEYQLTGKVQTPWFTVNVGWQFILTPSSAIALVKVNLLASLQELANLRQ